MPHRTGQLCPAATTSRYKLTFPFRSRINTADADIVVGKYPEEMVWTVSKSTVGYGSVTGRTLPYHHSASSSPLLAAFPDDKTKLAVAKQTTSGECFAPYDVQQDSAISANRLFKK